MKKNFLIFLIVVGSISLPVFAEKAPLPVEELQEQADAIVIATIEDIRVEAEPSLFEPAWGNSDWGIYLTLKLETVEEGNVADGELETRCFRIRQRRSSTEYLTPSGHHPIPAIGTRVRAYLEKESATWRVLLPNGIFCLDGDAQDAREIVQLSGRAYTYFLPLEIWILLIFICIPVLIFFMIIVRRHKRRKQPLPISQETEQGDSMEPK